MARKQLYITLIFIFITCITRHGWTCSSFVLDSESGPVIGKNMDWYDSTEGMILVNKRGVQKEATIDPVYDVTPANWISRFGSITFNLWFQEFPLGGINEAGLVVETLETAFTSDFPDPDSRPCITELQWVQYMLDNFSTVNEVIESDTLLRIFPFGPQEVFKNHYFIGDRLGNSAVIEFIDGKMVSYTSSAVPVKVLANSPYARSIQFWQQGQQPLPFYGNGYFFFQYDSYKRFMTAADMVTEYKSKVAQSANDYAFNILDEVYSTPNALHSGFGTQWSIVYNLPNNQIDFFTKKNDLLRTIDLKDFDFSCETPIMALGVNDGSEGNISGNFVELTPELNREFMLAANEPWISEEIIDIFLEYFETLTCFNDYVSDADNDTVSDSEDNCPTLANPDQLDTDNDTFGDVCDTSPLDIDNDGINDAVDNCPEYYNPDQKDTDGDGEADVCDDDSDNDGILDATDNCLFIENPDQDDDDGDEIGNQCDNCPNKINLSQTDIDNDGIGDACDFFTPFVFDSP